MKDSGGSSRRHCTQCGEMVSGIGKFCTVCGSEVRRSEAEDFTTSGGDDSVHVHAGNSDTSPRAEAPEQSTSNNLKEKFFGFVEWFKGRPFGLKFAVLAVIGIAALTVLSPVTFILSIAVLVASLVFLVRLLYTRKSPRLVSAIVAGSLMLALIFGGVSDTIWGTEFVPFVGGPGPIGTDAIATAPEEQYDSGDVAESDYDTLSYEEKEYVASIADLEAEMRFLVDDQIRLHDYCLEACMPEHLATEMENLGSATSNYQTAEGLSTPYEYENSHTQFINGMYATSDLVEKLTYQVIGPLEAQDLIDEANSSFSGAVLSLPSDAQEYYYSEYERVFESGV